MLEKVTLVLKEKGNFGLDIDPFNGVSTFLLKKVKEKQMVWKVKQDKLRKA